MERKRLLVLGSGYTGVEVARRGVAEGLTVFASVRRPEQVADIERLGATPLLREALDSSLAEYVDPSTHVVVTFPPDGATDERIAPALARAGAITYVSTTSVYGNITGHIDDDTPVPAPTEQTRPRLLAEATYRNLGGTVLRCPGIYGATRGLHRRVLRGEYSMPGDGSAISSRIHVYDLASFILASTATRAETFVVGDLQPATQREVVGWICATHGLPLPGSAPIAGVSRTLKANRAIDSERARRLLGVALRYPTFREGMSERA
ncbi:MAG TPA: hypothetical protein VFQ35_05610 [Polyangiaceae bacterium]|nr:hypothetical protein [Polyangiaceae bacterium]